MTPAQELPRRPRRAGDAVGVELDGETVLYHETTMAIHHLDPMATVVWRALDGSGSVEELVDDLAAVYRGDPGVIERDVRNLLSQLARQGLLEDVAPDPAWLAEVSVTEPEAADPSRPRGPRYLHIPPGG